MEYWNAPRNMDKAPGLYTGQVSLPWPGGYEYEGNATVAQDLPLPFLLGGLVQEILIEGQG